jgi:hypothetical protein
MDRQFKLKNHLLRLESHWEGKFFALVKILEYGMISDFSLLAKEPTNQDFLIICACSKCEKFLFSTKNIVHFQPVSQNNSTTDLSVLRSSIYR